MSKQAHPEDPRSPGLAVGSFKLSPQTKWNIIGFLRCKGYQVPEQVQVELWPNANGEMDYWLVVEKMPETPSGLTALEECVAEAVAREFIKHWPVRNDTVVVLLDGWYRDHAVNIDPKGRVRCAAWEDDPQLA